MHLIESLKNFIPISDYFKLSLEEITELKCVRVSTKGFYRSYYSQELFDFIKPYFPDTNITASYQVAYRDMAPHIDNSRKTNIIKRVCYLYPLSVGGPNVKTVTWNKDKKIDEFKSQENEWFKLRIDHTHSVEGITEPPRICISLRELEYVD